jgi:hypothetical protein
MDDVLDVVEEPIEELDAVAAEGEVSESEADPKEQQPAQDDPYTTRYSRDMRAALKALEAGNPDSAKFLKQARDNHARLFALNQLEPKGVDGVREKYALLNSLTLGESKGADALTAMQDELRSVQEVDALLAAGDPKALEALGDDFNDGLAKLTPTILSRIEKVNPEAYQAAILPHLVKTLASSPLVAEFNALVDVLSTQNDPRFDDKTKAAFTIQQLTKMGNWMNQQQEKAGKAPVVATSPQSEADPRAEIERERQELHWERNIYPETKKAVEDAFNKQLAPLQARLKLSPAQRAAAFEDFKRKNHALGLADKDYMRTMNNYRGQKNPDAVAIMNSVRAKLAVSAKEAFAQVRAERWDSFLGGKPKSAPVATVKTRGPVEPNVEIRTVKPPMNEIDHRNTPLDWLAQKKYRLTNGRVIQVRANA